jgi:crotonobetainyl-CoA:carnitine CoA-transferase CaiB-like acyl-CoA transferase
MMSAQIGQFQFTGSTPRRWGTRLKEFVPLGVYRTTDGAVAIAAATEKLFRDFGTSMDVPWLADDPRFRTLRSREENRTALEALIQEKLGEATTAEWLDRFDRFGIPASPVNSVRELLLSPELADSQQMVELEDADGFKIVAAPYRLDGSRPVARNRSERLGESTDWFTSRFVKDHAS